MSAQKVFTSAVFAFSVIYTFAAHAGAVDYYYSRLQTRTQKLRTLEFETVSENYYQQQVDHATPALGTFAQRYYIDESYANGINAPVFMYLCGEATCDETVFTSTLRTLAQKYHARLVALEHRYYGKSLPRKTFSVTDLKYLNHDNVMSDIVDFEKNMIHDKQWTGKWIVFGGSYSAGLAAYYREKYPEMVAGAVASSAPVMPMLTFPEFDEHTTASVGSECAGNMRRVVQDIEFAMSNNDGEIDEIKAKFNASEVKDNIDFLQFVADIGSGAVQYGYKDTFCDFLEKSPVALDGYAAFANYVLDVFGVTAVQLTPQGEMSEDPADYPAFFGARQWSYQVCTEFGAWAIASSDPQKSTRSQLLNAEYNQNVCRRLFGIGDKPNTDALYKQFYLPLLDESISSNVYFTNGSNDPWSRMSMIDENGNTTNKNMSYFMIEGGAHCDDLRKDDNQSESLKQAREKMDALIGSWLGK